MANKVEVSKILAKKFVPTGSRYFDSTVLYYGEDKYITFPIYRKQIIPKTSRDRYTVINKSTEYRPDLVSTDFYGTSIFWWKIMEANNIKDVFDFKAGLSLYIPADVY